MKPISVIVPLQEKRRKFFEKHCLPTIQANNPAEIIIVDNIGNACEKRNTGLVRASQPYVFFCDDDVILMPNCFDRLLEEIGMRAFCYCNSIRIWKNNEKVVTHRSIPFSYTKLKLGNYVSTMSLVVKNMCPGFDPSIKRLQDWDMFLTMAEKGALGEHVDEYLWIAFHNDSGITKKTGWEKAERIVREKHGI